MSMPDITITISKNKMTTIKRWRTADSDEVPRASGVLFVAHQTDQDPLHLLVKRAARCNDWPEHWAFPGGGIEHQETSIMAACRECREELGIAPVISQLRSAGISDGFECWVQHVDAAFVPKLNDEHTDYMWVSKNDLPRPMHPNAEQVLKRFYQPY